MRPASCSLPTFRRCARKQACRIARPSSPDSHRMELVPIGAAGSSGLYFELVLSHRTPASAEFQHFTPKTITDSDQLLSELGDAARDGYAVDESE
jgi:Bacterial transcriptional regulator